MEKLHTLYKKNLYGKTPYENGSFNMLHFCTFNNTLKINWAKHLKKIQPLSGTLFHMTFSPYLVDYIFYYFVIIMLKNTS